RRPLRARRTLGSLRAGVALRALRSGVTLGALRSGIALGAGRPLRAGITVVTPIALFTLRALRARGTSAVEDIAGSVVVDVLGLEIASGVLVEVPAAHAVPPLVSFRTRVALRPLRPVVTLGALRAAVAVVALVTLRTLRAGIAAVALR